MKQKSLFGALEANAPAETTFHDDLAMNNASVLS